MLKGIVSGAPVDISRITMRGKNLFDKDNYNILQAYFPSLQGTVTLTYESANRCVWIPCKPNTVYTASRVSGKRFAIGCTVDRPADGVTVYNVVGSSSGTTNLTTTTTADANYLVVYLRNGNISGETSLSDIINSLQIVEGSTALPYEPYGMQQGWEVRDQQGAILWAANKTLTGTNSIPMKGYGLPLVGMTLAGNETQTGTPTPDSPIWPQETGDLVTTGEHAGLYAIPINLNGVTQNIYLNEPLRKIGDYADTVDESGTVTRKIKKQAITELANRDNFNGGYTVAFNAPCGFGTLISNIAVSTSSLPTAANRQGKVFTNSSKTFIGFGSQPEFPIANTSGYPTAEEKAAFLSYISTHEVYVWYVLATPTTEQVTVPTLTPADGNDTLTVGTTLAPSALSITGHVKARSV